MYSLQYRLAILLGSLLIAIFGLNLLLMNYFPRYLTEEHVLTRLQHDSDTLLERLVIKTGHDLHLRGRYISPIYVLRFSGHYFRMQVGNAVLRSASLQDDDLILPPIKQGKPTITRMMGPNQQQILVWTKVVRKAGHIVTISIAEDISDIQDDISQLQRIYLFGTILTVLLLLSLQTLIVRKTLKPIKHVRREILEIEQGHLEKIQQTVPSEIQPLVDEINHLLISMQKRIERSRNATGNLAHALKTPLSVLTQLIDSPELKAQPKLSEEIQHISQRMKQAIERELKRSRLVGTSLPGQKFNVAEEFPALIAVMEKIYAHKQIKIRLDVPENKTYQGDREDMLELFGNLLDNACKWAKQQVIVTIDDTEGLHCSIEDDGKGVEQAKLDILMQRGERLDETIAGHGLGLSIVKEIVEQYQGEIKFGSSSLGGFKVDLSL